MPTAAQTELFTFPMRGIQLFPMRPRLAEIPTATKVVSPRSVMYVTGQPPGEAEGGMLGTNDREGRRALIAGYAAREPRSEEHTSELQSLMRKSYAVFCL